MYKEDENRDKDNWLHGVTREDLKKAKAAQEKRLKKAAPKESGPETSKKEL